MQKVRRHPYGLRPLVSTWFQVLLTQLTAVLFTFQSPYYFTIGHRVVFSLARWSAQLHTEFHELRITLVRLSTPIRPYAYGAITRSGRLFHTVLLGLIQLKAPATPGRILVWAVPISLAATDGIDVSFYSCRYLDVSVPCVRSLWLYIHHRVTRRWGFPIRKSWDHCLFASYSKLFVGYHVLRRLSMPRHPPCTLSNLITLIDHPRLRVRRFGMNPTPCCQDIKPIIERSLFYRTAGSNRPDFAEKALNDTP
jgi:hypothetical protein